MSQFEFTNTTISAPDSYSSYKHLDTLWMVSFNNSNNIPMWTGWNTHTHREQCPQQIITYMNPIPLPPTRTDVVNETLIRSKEVSEECRTRHTIVTSDQKKCQRNAGQDILLLLQIKRSVRGMQVKTYYCYFRSKEVSEECRSRHTIVTSDQKKC